MTLWGNLEPGGPSDAVGLPAEADVIRLMRSMKPAETMACLAAIHQQNAETVLELLLGAAQRLDPALHAHLLALRDGDFLDFYEQILTMCEALSDPLRWLSAVEDGVERLATVILLDFDRKARTDPADLENMLARHGSFPALLRHYVNCASSVGLVIGVPEAQEALNKVTPAFLHVADFLEQLGLDSDQLRAWARSRSLPAPVVVRGQA